MVLFDVTSLEKNIPIIDTLNIIKIMLIMVINLLGKQLHIKTSFLIWLIWFWQPLGVLLVFSFRNKLMVLQWEDQHRQPQQKFICRLMNKLQYLWHYKLQKFGNNLLMIFIPFINIWIWKTSIASTIFIKILSSLWRKKVLEN